MKEQPTKPATSPLPVTKVVEIEDSEPMEMDFYYALHELVNGKSVTKLEWNDPTIILRINDERLQIFNPDKQWHDLILRAPDIIGQDWIIV